ncbi:MAG: M50 family metallopeptidase [Micropepsaceae bacterium]
MGGAIDLGRILGVNVRIEMTVLLLAAFIIVDGFGARGTSGLLDSATFAVLFIFCIYLHEMGHAFGGWLFGIRTLDVTLTFFGGYARLVGVPRGSFQNVVVSFAGPAANLLIAGVLYWYSANVDGTSYVVSRLAFANLFLGIFNLLPGYPLDGGHIAAAVLSNFMPMGRARVVTGYIGVAIGLLLIGLGLQSGLGGTFTMLVGFMLILAASQEIQANSGGRF